VSLSVNREDMARRLAAWLLGLPGPFAAPCEEDGWRLAHRAFDYKITIEEFSAALQDFGYAVQTQAGQARIVSMLDEAPPRRTHRWGYQNHAPSTWTQTDRSVSAVLKVA
jgi:hypothetical protein